MRWNMRDIVSAFRDETILHLPPVAVLPTILYVHMRAGDIFKRCGSLHEHYGQPPCNYYLDVIEMDKRKHTSNEIIAENDWNPSMRMVQRHGGNVVEHNY
jgi:hypothetical protein